MSTCCKGSSFEAKRRQQRVVEYHRPTGREHSKKKKRKKLDIVVREKMSFRTPAVVALVEQLRQRRDEMHMHCCNPVERFRRDSRIVDLVDSVRDLVRNLNGKSDCPIEWMAFQMELDLVSILLRVEAVARRELMTSKKDATEIILLVWELLPIDFYWQYVGGEKEDAGEEIIRHAWAMMFNRKELDEKDGKTLGQLSREMYGIMRAVHAHAVKHHVRGQMPTCEDYRTTMKAYADGEQFMKASGGMKEMKKARAMEARGGTTEHKAAGKGKKSAK